jgi:magnesium chelatase family protein
MGELGLDGSIHSVKGALPIAIQARKEQFKGLIIPQKNASEAAIVNQLPVFAFDHLLGVIRFFQDKSSSRAVAVDARGSFLVQSNSQELDFCEVKGQENIKRALEIAAAGGHNAILIGPPGAGKTMLARRLPGILPPLSLQEALETTKIHSVAGKLPEYTTLLSQRPFRSPHHTISGMALVGGGSIPQPGEISLAHNGVLFLDELPEFARSTLEMMRQPMEDRKVLISRAALSVEFPSSFILIASMNPCPCGYYNHPDKECTCPAGAVSKYLHRISGPLLDRIDLHVEVVPMSYAQLRGSGNGDSSGQIRQRVTLAREIQRKRYESEGQIYCNAQISGRLLNQYCRIDARGDQLVRMVMDKMKLSVRAHDHILKIGRTIADLAGSDCIGAEHLAEAIQFRSLDREGWAA